MMAMKETHIVIELGKKILGDPSREPFLGTPDDHGRVYNLFVNQLNALSSN